MVDNGDDKDDKELKKGKSKAWLHFEKIRIDDAIKDVCKYCNTKLRGDSSTGPLI